MLRTLSDAASKPVEDPEHQQSAVPSTGVTETVSAKSNFQQPSQSAADVTLAADVEQTVDDQGVTASVTANSVAVAAAVITAGSVIFIAGCHDPCFKQKLIASK
jgi:hypothetical protein